MKIVLDTNVLIAAFIARGHCSELLEHCVHQHYLITSDFILAEFREKLVEKFQAQDQDANEACRLLSTKMEIVVPVDLGVQVCRDLDDDNILGTAAAGNCECIVTGDRDLLVLRNYAGFDIVSPSEFSEYEARKSAE